MHNEQWLPDFCRPMALFGVIALAQLVVMVVLYAPLRESFPSWAELGAASLFAQWLALMSAALLCLLRAPLGRLGPWAGWPLACLIPILVTASGSAVVHWLDVSLALALSVPAEQGTRFIIGNTTVCALVTLATLRYFHIQNRATQHLRAQAQAQLDALQARIRPHFLFNAMNTIASLIAVRPQDAETAVEDLCELFRASLSDDSRRNSVGDELDIIRRYLNIETLRLGERLRVDWQVADDVLQLPLPSLLWQPLVENAVYHGIQTAEHGGELQLVARREGKHLLLEVGNPVNGRKSTHQGLGMAMNNIRQRLMFLHNGEARLDVDDQPDYHRVSLRIPLHERVDRR